MKIDLFGNIVQEDEPVDIKPAPKPPMSSYLARFAKKTGHPDDWRNYDWYNINSVLSRRKDTCLFANEMNKYYNLPIRAQFDFYYYGLPKRNLFTKWDKPVKSEYTQMVMAYFNVSLKVAKQYERVLTEKQFAQIRDWYASREGGKGK